MDNSRLPIVCQPVVCHWCYFFPLLALWSTFLEQETCREEWEVLQLWAILDLWDFDDICAAQNMRVSFILETTLLWGPSDQEAAGEFLSRYKPKWLLIVCANRISASSWCSYELIWLEKLLLGPSQPTAAHNRMFTISMHHTFCLQVVFLDLWTLWLQAVNVMNIVCKH